MTPALKKILGTSWDHHRCHPTWRSAWRAALLAGDTKFFLRDRKWHGFRQVLSCQHPLLSHHIQKILNVLYNYIFPTIRMDFGEVPLPSLNSTFNPRSAPPKAPLRTRPSRSLRRCVPPGHQSHPLPPRPAERADCRRDLRQPATCHAKGNK